MVEFQPDLIKIDMKIIRGIGTSRALQAVVASIVGIARTLDITVLAEGIDTEEEFLVLKATGIRLFQGYWFARPAFEALPSIGPVSAQALRLTA